MQKVFRLFVPEQKSVVIGRRSATRTVLADTGRQFTVDLTDQEAELVESISGVGVAPPNTNGTRVLTAIFGNSGAITQMMAIHTPERPSERGGVMGGVLLSTVAQTEMDPDSRELRIRRREDPNNPDAPGRQVSWDRFSTIDPALQSLLQSAQVKTCLAALAAAAEPTTPAATTGGHVKPTSATEAAYSE